MPSDDGGEQQDDGEGGQQGPSSDTRRSSGGGGEGGGQNGAPPSDTRPDPDKVVQLYHELCPTLPRVQVVNDQRRKTIGARWKAAQAG